MPDCFNKLPAFLKECGFAYLDAEAFHPAFTHSSYSCEHNLNINECYERFEFLGDAVLKLTMSNILFTKYPDFQEGKLTNIRAILVSDDFLFNLADDLGLCKYIRMSAALEKSGGRNNPAISACVFEAFLGTLFYLGVSVSDISDFLEKLYDKYINNLKFLLQKFNSKAILQEYTQAKNNDRPEYKVVSTSGNENNLIFCVNVSYHGDVIADGFGKTKKQAEREAAYNACLKWNIMGEKYE